jgi:hypothetical protein
MNIPLQTAMKAALLTVLAISVVPGVAKADVIYDFTLFSGGNAVGTGQLDLDTAISTNSFSFNTAEKNSGGKDDANDSIILGITITVDGHTFTMANETSPTTAGFATHSSDIVNNLSYNDEGGTLPRFQMFGGTSSNGWQLALTNGPITDSGTWSFNFTPQTATPEPASVALVIPLVLLIAAWRVRKALVKA